MLIKFNERKLYGIKEVEFKKDKVYDLEDAFAARWLVRGCVEVDSKKYKGKTLKDPRFFSKEELDAIDAKSEADEAKKMAKEAEEKEEEAKRKVEEAERLAKAKKEEEDRLLKESNEAK